VNREPESFELPVVSQTGPDRRLPRWLKRKVPKGNFSHFTAELVSDLSLQTVCDHARCPNRMECYSRKTATFMILGKVCTRSCAFCAVDRGIPNPVDADEPRRIAEAVKRLELKHVVITSVTRDDLPDGGAEHFCQCIQAVRGTSDASIEVLTPDFLFNPQAVDRVVDARPDVFNHNAETVPRLYRKVRGPKSDYRWTLELLGHVKRRDPASRTKSGLMLGLGESREELLDVLADLVDCGCDYLTLGQYLQPLQGKLLPAVRYLPPEEFTELGELARSMGFRQVASGPFVRSSYHAHEMAESDIDRDVQRPRKG
jgi:lipoic acid synthetase